MGTGIAYAQLWVEERQILAERAALVPDNGTIVEIGTAQGGSASIFHGACGHRRVKIYSFDIAPSAEAYENLKDTNVTIVAQSSREGSRIWKQTVQRPIDLLFIDGSHALQHVFEDFNAWVPLLRPGGEIIFHDYDPPERGGSVHLGAHIVVDTVLRCGFLDRAVHRYRMLYGTVANPGGAPLKAKDCYQTFANLGRRVVRIRDGDYSDATLVGDKRFAELAAGCLAISGRPPVSPEEVSVMDPKYLVFARPLVDALDLLRKRGVSEDRLVTIDNLQACYIVAEILRRNRDYLLTLMSSRKEFFRWEEMLFMLEHGVAPSRFPDVAPDPRVGSDVSRLSQIVAREQIRLAILSHLLRTFVDWTL